MPRVSGGAVPGVRFSAVSGFLTTEAAARPRDSVQASGIDRILAALAKSIFVLVHSRQRRMNLFQDFQVAIQDKQSERALPRQDPVVLVIRVLFGGALVFGLQRLAYLGGFLSRACRCFSSCFSWLGFIMVIVLPRVFGSRSTFTSRQKMRRFPQGLALREHIFTRTKEKKTWKKARRGPVVPGCDQRSRC